jgi:hypothetical protein
MKTFNTEEAWRTLPGFSKYEFSSFGNVRSIDSTDSMGRLKRGKVLKLQNSSNGYVILTLSSDNAKKTFQVHRLIAMAFLPNDSNMPCVNHINGNKQDNKVQNLQWCSYSENNQHAFDSKLKLPTKQDGRPGTKLSLSKARLMRELARCGNEPEALSKRFKVCKQIVKDVLANKRWKEPDFI